MSNNFNLPKKTLTNHRIDFSKISGTLSLPYLVEIQTDSFKWFLSEGIEEVLKDVFPINNYADNLVIEYVGCHFEEPKYDYLECKTRDFTYSAPLKVKLRLRFKETGEIKESDVFMGDFPLMTDSGTFIVNGAERVIVSQLVRSPGAYMSKTMDKSGKWIFEGDLIPTRGTWLEFESDAKDILNVRIDRQRKMFASIFLKALGLTDDEKTLELFDSHPAKKSRKKKADEKGDDELSPLELTLRKDAETRSSNQALFEIFRKLKPGEPSTEEGIANFIVQKFFDHKRYDLGRAGRYKFAKKLGIYNRLTDMILAENLVSADGEIVFPAETLLTKEIVEDLQAQKFFEKGAHVEHISINQSLDSHDAVNVVRVYTNDKKEKIVSIVGTDLTLTDQCVTIPDMIATFSYFMNIQFGIGQTDDIDHLGNRRVRCVGELIQNQFRIGLSKMAKAVKEKMSISEIDSVTPQSLVNIRPLTASIKEFFASSQLSQFMDQTNPLAELTNKRRLSALGPGGLTRDRASFEVRDVHYSHYGRICPIETPEGQNIGLINNLACYAKVNKYGFLETPYRKVERGTGKVLDRSEYLSADQEREFVIAQANVKLDANNIIIDENVVARHDGENIVVSPTKIDYIDVSPKQIVSIAAACIPFLENDDAMRALMGANMQRQALPLLRPHAPFVGTGMEAKIAHDSGSSVVAKADGVVTYVDSRKIIVDENGTKKVYLLQKYARSNQGTCFNQKPIVNIGQVIKTGDVIADGPAMENGDLALGQNVTIAFMTWNGYNYEDAVIMSERLVKDDVYTSIHIEEYDVKCRETKLGKEEITRDIPNVGEDAKKYLDERGIIVPGAEVKEGDIIVGKTTPKGQSEPSPVEKLMMAIASDKAKEGKDTSLRVPHGGAGTVVDVKIFTRKSGDELPPGVDQVVRVYIAQKRKISEGDKMSGRHGNKGVISRILPEEDMPFLPDGTPVDIMLNPLGVPSRMNIGQILEIHLGMACKRLGIKIATPVFDGMSNEEIFALMNEAGLPKDGKTILYDGRTGERFDERISVGVMYMIKLVHMVDDKLHARATGPYSLVTQQPLGGKAQNGGQRFGEMEVWALEAYGAAHTLQEILTIKSDDRVGRRRAYESIIKGRPLPQPGIPESFKVLTKEFQGLALDVQLLDSDGSSIDLNQIAKDNIEEERRIRRSIRDKDEGDDQEEIVVDETELTSTIADGE
ncbi:MAG: DNA-directed RNA polymerase subunit beta [Bacilli bacterium]|jgi:DNA-directed RNA polymerase subunit beta|nr:DNA-directed RNA polymerase subunit beta [Bacilli bacterium]MCH4202360.1 DNA-directed RNA polymerase subunit beta [Bacilli bacterium]MCH4235462.1 DNA-directed RNA polymerase subunit beta [Bacilli bacterium]